MKESLQALQILAPEPVKEVEFGQGMILDNLVDDFDRNHKANTAFFDLGSVKEVALSLCIEVVVVDEKGCANLRSVSVLVI